MEFGRLCGAQASARCFARHPYGDSSFVGVERWWHIQMDPFPVRVRRSFPALCLVPSSEGSAARFPRQQKLIIIVSHEIIPLSFVTWMRCWRTFNCSAVRDGRDATFHHAVRLSSAASLPLALMKCNQGFRKTQLNKVQLAHLLNATEGW